MTKPMTQLPIQPTNIIFTGVAGTGKTHRLLAIQKRYDESIDASWDEWRLQQIAHYNWCDVVCAVLLLENRMMTVPEMMRHALVQDKAAANKRNDNINQTLWVQLNKHAHPDSTTVNTTQRSANYYFDKTESSQWFVLDEVVAMLKQRLAELLSFYDDICEQQHAQQHVVSRSSLVSFHQSYGYDEFVEGIRPRINPQTGQMQYTVQDGAFLELCAKASADPEHRYAMLIDEINRANTAQVFGELMSVIEPSKRAGGSTPMTVRLAYSGRQFVVPNNVDIYATMNTQDHSLAALDMAFRRRFDFVDCAPDSSVVSSVADDKGNEVDLAQMMDFINQRLSALFGDEALLGQSYFMHITTIAQLAQRLQRQIIPQIMAHAKHTVGPMQLPEVLAQLLYGKPLDEVLKDNNSLFEKPEKLSTEQLSNSQSQPYQTQSMGQSVTLAAEFIAVANTAEASQMAAAELSECEQYYLTAKPYQQLYAMS